MAVTVQGLPDPHNVINWQVQEDITPIDPGSTAGGVGQLTVSTVDWPLSRMASGTDLVLDDDVHGRFAGTVRDVDGDGVIANLTADSELGNLNVTRTTGPFSGRLEDLFQHYLDLANVYTPLDFQAINVNLNVPGFVGNVWDHVKQLCAAYQVEMVYTGDAVVVRPIRSRTVTLPNETSYGYSVNRQDASLSVDVTYYNYKWVDKGEVFPVMGEEAPIHSVEAGEIAEFEIEVNASLRRVYQPVCAASAGPNDRSGSDGVYTVVGNDNLPIQPRQWLDHGGRVEVHTTDEPGRLLLRITGAQIEHLSPFRIAESAGGTDYNSLHITGDGVTWQQNAVRMFSGANPLRVSSEEGPTVDNPYIANKSMALRTGIHSAIAVSGSQARISGGSNQLVRETTFANLVGARVAKDDAIYRVENVSAGPDGLSFEGTIDVTVKDFNEAWAGRTTAQFNETWGDSNGGQFSLMPLRTEPYTED